MNPRGPSRTGVALVVVLWVVTIAGLLLMGVIRSTRVNLAMADGELDSVRARWLARAGLEQAMAVLEDDLTDVDGPLDAWFDNPELFHQVALTGGTFTVQAPAPEGVDPRTGRYGLVDHCARLDINTADEKQLAELPGITSAQIDAILDWRDGDDTSRAGGAEAGYYQRLRYPYPIRNGALRTPDELRLVRSMDDETFLGEDGDRDGLLDAGEDDLAASWPPDDGDGLLRPGLAGMTTVWSYELNRTASGAKRVNVRTADKKAMTEQLGFSDALADAVAQKRPNTLIDLLSIQPRAQGGGGAASQPAGGGGQSGSSAGGQQDKVQQVTIQWLAEHLDEVTVSDEDRLPGRINVNTASREMLLTLPEMTDETAGMILARQTSAQGPFRSVGELFTSGTLSDKQFRAIAERVTVRAAVLEIHSTGVTASGVRSTLVAVVDRGGGQTGTSTAGASDGSGTSGMVGASGAPMTVLYWYQGE